MRIAPVHLQAAASGHRRSAAGFTLIELLVVVAIIAVLAGLLLPAFASVKRKGQQTTSISNLRQWGAALSASLGDNNNVLPTDGQATGSIKLTDTDAWFNRLPPYIKEKPLSDPIFNNVKLKPKAGAKSVWINPAVPTTVNSLVKSRTDFFFCYAMNYWLYSSSKGTVSMSAIEYPSGTVFLAETGELNFSVCNPTYIHAYYGTPDVIASTGEVTKKNPESVANFLFCDGHVRSLTRKEFDVQYGSDAAKAAVDDSPTSLINSGFTFKPYVGAAH